MVQALSPSFSLINMNALSPFGATVGWVANRISEAQFTLNGTRYKLSANSGDNTIHGCRIGFSKVVWKMNKYSPKVILLKLSLSITALMVNKDSLVVFGVIVGAKASTRPLQLM